MSNISTGTVTKSWKDNNYGVNLAITTEATEIKKKKILN